VQQHTLYYSRENFEKSSKMASNWEGKWKKINLQNLRSTHFSVKFPKPKKPKSVNRPITSCSKEGYRGGGYILIESVGGDDPKRIPPKMFC